MPHRRPVCLVQPPVRFTTGTACLDDQQYGLGILALKAWLEAHGFPVVARHFPLALRQGRTVAELVDDLRRTDPLLVAIGLNWVHFSRGTMELAEALRAAMPDVPRVVGGQHATLFASEIMDRYGHLVDAVIVGEAEWPLLEICRSVSEWQRIDPAIRGVCLPDGSSGAPHVEPDLDSLPLYSYQGMWPRPERPDVGAVSTARGACPFRCAYCIEPVVGRAQGRPRIELHSAEHIAAQMELLGREGIDRFTIQDGFFVGGDRLLAELADALSARGFRPRHVNVFAHAESYGPEGLAALAAMADRATIDLGVETGAASVARRVGRPVEPEGVVAAVEAATAAGVTPYTWWLVGLPGEGPDARAATRRLLLETMRAGAIPRWVSPLILLPRTPMYERGGEYGVRPRFHGFDDYLRFSDTSLAEALHFPDLITHETDEADAEDILAESRSLRRFILDHLHDLRIACPHSVDGESEVDVARRTIQGSFF